jgi:aspartate oxidase
MGIDKAQPEGGAECDVGLCGNCTVKKAAGAGKRRVHVIYQEIEDYYKKSKITEELVELRNMAAVAFLIITSALRRNESRGLHYMTDFPEKSDRFLKDTII